MKKEQYLQTPVNELYDLRETISMEMVEASGKQLASLQVKLSFVEEAIYIKESENATN